MDKQIIIDDVDVSGCEFLIINKDKQMCRCIKSDLFGGIEFVENAKNGNCKDNSNCYYKQLKRKEQECKDLREDIKDIANLLDLDTGEEYNFGNIELEIKQLQAKEQECEELKQNLQEIKSLCLEQNLKADFFACEILQKINEVLNDR